MRTRYIVLLSAAVVLIAAAILATGPIVRAVKFGSQFPVGQESATDETHDITVDAGDRFSIVVRDNASVLTVR